ncbi:hypothetical protein GCM10010981_13590 [Dyella nitratireducens]|uniref:Dermonecrotic toxin N-terminal domain-containing protein n=1 Tax=Dyella nitratireducens TaxID=1849580 RepID=A0ABQ1FQ91_9GAMM|nr:hypothetical protein GCM10010981_13590 [Dyella nitratireducens]GLQ43577.1 hypothetical protein GCM10007902_34270 [Dyella nitratireducens]
MLTKHASELGLTPEQIENLDLDNTYWTEYEPSHSPQRSASWFPPPPNPKAGQFIRSIPLSQIPVTNIPDAIGDGRFRITTSDDPQQTYDTAPRADISPEAFAKAFGEENTKEGGFKASYQQQVNQFFDSQHGTLKQLQHDKAQFLLDQQQANGQVKDLGPADYTFLRQALNSDPAVKEMSRIYPLEIAGYQSPSALVIEDTRPNGPTYLYLPDEPQPCLRFKDKEAAKQYVHHRTDDPAGAHGFATTYFSYNDAAGTWDNDGVERYLNDESDYRRSQLHPTVGDNPGGGGDLYLMNRRDISADPFGQQVDIAKEKALDQANFDITSDADKADKRRYDEWGRYWYLPGHQLVQLAYAKTGAQKAEAAGSLAGDILGQVLLDGLGRVFGGLLKEAGAFAKAEAEMPKPELSEPVSPKPEAASPKPEEPPLEGGKPQSPSPPDKPAPPPSPTNTDLEPYAANVTEEQLQPGGGSGIRVGKDGYSYARVGDKYYQVVRDLRSQSGKPVYRVVDPQDPYGFGYRNPIFLRSDGKGGWVPEKLGLRGGSDDMDFNAMKELDLDEESRQRLIQEERDEPTPPNALDGYLGPSDQPQPGPSTAISGPHGSQPPPDLQDVGRLDPIRPDKNYVSVSPATASLWARARLPPEVKALSPMSNMTSTDAMRIVQAYFIKHGYQVKMEFPSRHGITPGLRITDPTTGNVFVLHARVGTNRGYDGLQIQIPPRIPNEPGTVHVLAVVARNRDGEATEIFLRPLLPR